MATRSAIRLSQRQFDRLVSLESERLAVAEVWRRWARWCGDNGFSRPSYELTRRLVAEIRAVKRQERAFAASLARRALAGTVHDLDPRA